METIGIKIAIQADRNKMSDIMVVLRSAIHAIEKGKLTKEELITWSKMSDAGARNEIDDHNNSLRVEEHDIS